MAGASMTAWGGAEDGKTEEMHDLQRLDDQAVQGFIEGLYCRHLAGASRRPAPMWA